MLGNPKPTLNEQLTLNNALLYAVERGDIDAFQMLLNQDANVDAKGNYDLTVLMHAIFYAHTEMVRLLLERGANVHAVNSIGKNALVFAVEKGHFEMVRLLLEHGADANTKDHLGTSVLIRAADKRYTEIVTLLLFAQGADVNARDKNGETALMWAASCGYTEIVKVLKELPRTPKYLCKIVTQSYHIYNGFNVLPTCILAGIINYAGTQGGPVTVMDLADNRRAARAREQAWWQAQQPLQVLQCNAAQQIPESNAHNYTAASKEPEQSCSIQ